MRVAVAGGAAEHVAHEQEEHEGHEQEGHEGQTLSTFWQTLDSKLYKGPI